MRVEYHPATASDLNNAITHYNAERPDLGNAFRTEAYATIDRILENPRLYAETEGVRRALVKRFPYSVIYRLVADDCVRILIIRHHRRHPGHGMRRQ